MYSADRTNEEPWHLALVTVAVEKRGVYRYNQPMWWHSRCDWSMRAPFSAPRLRKRDGCG